MQIDKLLNTFIKISGFYILVGLILRSILIFLPITERVFDISDYAKIFLLGIVNDWCVSIVIFVFLWLHLMFLSNSKFKSPWGYIIIGVFIILLCYLYFFKTIFDDYGSIVPTIIKIFVTIKALSFIILFLFPSLRSNWRHTVYIFIFFLYIFLIIFNSISEYLFWNEFGVRYNFIAVDYLIYTNEVIGNILESYPVISMFSVILLISILITYFFTSKSNKYFMDFSSFKVKILSSLVYVVLVIGSVFLLEFIQKQENSDNVFANELQANGLFRFYEAFSDSSLDYEQFYAQIPINKAFALVGKQYDKKSKIVISEIIRDTLPELRKNVVLVTIESMSFDFMKYSGNTKNLTPNLDRLAKEGMFFTNLYATGNRTVRGLEAVTLCIPPSPGESLIKREDNDNLFSTGYIFKQKGYKVQFFYGGYSYFDDMDVFFKGNGYQIIDRNSFSSDEITFANIWGVCDEDMFKKAIKTFDENQKSNRPFFGHIMTVSNHRPFTYPEGRIDIPSTSKSRDGGVKYTDYAIGEFIKEAHKHQWFQNTVFVFVADHCASSAGKVNIPLERYHIPAIIYAPGFVKPVIERTLTSQIDLMPTLFGKLHFSYTSQFFGQNIKKSDYNPRALVSTYQNLGYYKGNELIVLSPNRKVQQYEVDSNKQLKATHDINKTLEEEAIANYQTTSYLIEQNLLKTNRKKK
ncbi:LTA synthase family protein [Apibacter raozihei]|uniref:LTA synthase family protein n=1 Tax=Apibacter raozihei TaxID=2500547 RepID=UPI000FE2FD81|nr:LTA synthase family protein [Apibacter raozihei]